MMRKNLAAGIVVVALLVCLSGCMGPQPAPQPDVRQTEEPEVRTLGLDSRDYNEMANRLSGSLLTDSVIPLDDTKVLSLGPVDTENCMYSFDTRRLQEKLQTLILRSRKMKINFAVDAMKDSDAASARYKVMLLQWMKESTVDPEDLRTFGTLANVDYLLLGRLSCQETTKGATTEVTYTFNWKIGECESGLLVWADDMEITKRK